ncbi:MAG: sigma-54-dependent Fis family transcriptional regulator [Deltaproteobacteria bacterium]|nr:sigma-54-dependent Fis family transcriptional regulator [Deltaproteobacteria bacterium]
MLCSMLGTWGYRTVEADDGDTAVAAVQNNPYDAVLMDIRMVRMDGREAFIRIHTIAPLLPVILMTAYSTVESAVETIQQGAHDYLTKPLDFDRLRLALERAVDHHQVIAKKYQEESPMPGLVSRIIGSSPPMIELFEMISYVAPTEATVLISGESGTGKELVAEALHENSERKNRPFVKVNCAALAEGLLETELFGHEKGAFTGAERKREGKFVQADGGTLFLDEIGETSQAMQVKLLRVLQEQELQRVGGEETISVDVRVIAATNRDLEEEVKKNNFRDDLYYRLNVVMIDVPPLRMRGEDIEELVQQFSDKFAEKNRRELESITPGCMDLLRRYPWPGNVRELENAIERGIILMRGSSLTEKSLPLAIQKFAEDQRPVDENRQLSIFEAEKQLVIQTVEATAGNKSEAARILGITRKTLLNKLKRYSGEN